MSQWVYQISLGGPKGLRVNPTCSFPRQSSRRRGKEITSHRPSHTKEAMHYKPTPSNRASLKAHGRLLHNVLYVYLPMLMFNIFPSGCRNKPYSSPPPHFLDVPQREDHTRSVSPLGRPPYPPQYQLDHWRGDPFVGDAPPPRRHLLPHPLHQEPPYHDFNSRGLEGIPPPSPPPPKVTTVLCEKILDLPGRNERPSHVSCIQIGTHVLA